MCLRCADPLSEGLGVQHSMDEKHLNLAGDRLRPNESKETTCLN